MASATEKNVWGQQTSARWWEGKNETGRSEQPVRWLKKKTKIFFTPGSRLLACRGPWPAKTGAEAKAQVIGFSNRKPEP